MDVTCRSRRSLEIVSIWHALCGLLQSGSNFGPGLLSSVEGAVLVVSANLPLLKPLFSHLPGRIGRESTGDDKYTKIQGQSGTKTLSSQGTSRHCAQDGK